MLVFCYVLAAVYTVAINVYGALLLKFQKNAEEADDKDERVSDGKLLLAADRHLRVYVRVPLPPEKSGLYDPHAHACRTDAACLVHDDPLEFRRGAGGCGRYLSASIRVKANFLTSKSPLSVILISGMTTSARKDRLIKG